MEYQIHDRTIVYHGSECGIYKSTNPLTRMEYAVMNIDYLIKNINDMLDYLIKNINDMSKPEAIEAVTALENLASKQKILQDTPQNPGFPILRQIPGPSTEIGEVREKIMNTEKLCNEILKALKGE